MRFGKPYKDDTATRLNNNSPGQHMANEAEEGAFKFITEKDLTDLKEIVDILKSQNLDVYNSGSGILVPEYTDIDLLICDLNFVIKDATKKEDFKMSPLAKTAIDNIIDQKGVVLKKKEHDYGADKLVQKFVVTGRNLITIELEKIFFCTGVVRAYTKINGIIRRRRSRWRARSGTCL